MNLQPETYHQITQTIINHLEQGTDLWQSNCFARTGYPKNFTTGNEYRGINLELLGLRRFVSPWYLTYHQAKQLGGQVRRGETGTRIFKYGRHKSEPDGENQSTAVDHKKGFVKRYTVFNASQIEGILFPEIVPPAPENKGRNLGPAAAIVEAMPDRSTIQEGKHATPFYSRKSDVIQIPGREFFQTLPHFYLTLFHELVHATGHETRLGRPQANRKSRKKTDQLAYAKEELIAELGASFLAARAGIVIDRHSDSAAYLSGWLKSAGVTESEKWIREAEPKAAAAADFILGFSD